MKEELQLATNVTLYRAHDFLELASTHNTATSGAKNLVAHAFASTPLSELPNVRVCSIGTGRLAPLPSDVEMNNYYHSVPLVNAPVIDANRVLFTFFLVGNDSEIFIREVGLFGTSQASSLTPNSGVLVARALLDHDNTGTNNADLLLTWRITVL